MKKLPFVFLALIFTLFVQASFAQSNVEGFIQKVVIPSCVKNENKISR